MRLGLSYDSPQWINIADETQQKISSFRSDTGISIKEIIEPNVINSFSPYELRIPAKSSVSFAYIFDKKGLLSIEYNYQNLSKNKLHSWVKGIRESWPYDDYMDEEKRKIAVQAYYGMCSFMDSNVGKLLSELILCDI